MNKITINNITQYTAPGRHPSEDVKMIMFELKTEDGLVFEMDYTYSLMVKSRLAQILAAVHCVGARFVYSKFKDDNMQDLLVGKCFMADVGERKVNPVSGKVEGYFIDNIQPVGEEEEDID